MECGVGKEDPPGDSESDLKRILAGCGVFPEDPAPDTLLGACGVNGIVDPTLMAASWARQDAFLASYLRGPEAPIANPPVKPKATRSHTTFLWRYVNGSWERKDPSTSQWYVDYILDPQQRMEAPNTADVMAKILKKFRRRFRLPYERFLQLVVDCKHHGWFSKFCSRNISHLDHPGMLSLTKHRTNNHTNTPPPPPYPLP